MNKILKNLYQIIVGIKRLNDNAASWANGTNTRFASTNECDYLLFNDHTHTLLALELKTTQGTLTYWPKRFW